MPAHHRTALLTPALLLLGLAWLATPAFAALTDLEFVSIAFSPRAGEPGPACNVDLTYRNPTTTDTGAFEITILIDGKLVERVGKASQLAGTTTTSRVVAPSILTKPDPHTITVLLDSNEEVAEFDETNNTGIAGLHVEDKNGDGVAEVCEAVPVPKPPEDKSGEEADGNFFLDVGGDVAVQLVSNVSESRSFFVIAEPTEKKPAVCLVGETSIDNCYFDTGICKKTKTCPKTPGPPAAIDDFEVQGECGDFGILEFTWSEPLTCDTPMAEITLHIENVATGFMESLTPSPVVLGGAFPEGDLHRFQLEAVTNQGSSFSNVVTACGAPSEPIPDLCPCGTVQDFSAAMDLAQGTGASLTCALLTVGELDTIFLLDVSDPPRSNAIGAHFPFQEAASALACFINEPNSEIFHTFLTNAQALSCVNSIEAAANLAGLTCPAFPVEETQECPCSTVQGIASLIESQKALGEIPTCTLEENIDKTTFLTIDATPGNLIFSDLPDQGKIPVCGSGPDSTVITDADALSCVNSIEAAAKLTGLKCAGFKKDGTDTKKACGNETELVGTFAADTRFRTEIHVDADGDGMINYVLHSEPSLNAGGIDYLHTVKVGPGIWRLEWEDTLGGGDQDFNDLVILLVSSPPGGSLLDSFLPGLKGTPAVQLQNTITIDPQSIPPAERLLRLTTSLYNYGAEIDLAVCTMINFTGTPRTGQGYTYFAGDGVPDCNRTFDPAIVPPGGLQPSVRLTLDQMQTSLSCPSPPPTLPRGDIITLPAAIGPDAPGLTNLFYQIPLSAIGDNLEFESPAIVRDRLVNSGLGVYLDTLYNINVGALICPNGVSSYFDAAPDPSVANASFQWYTPVIEIFSPAETQTALYSSLVFGRDMETEAIIDILWEDNLPVPLSGHLTHDPPIRSPFTILPGTKPTGLLTAQFPNDLPDGFLGKAVILVTEVDTGASIVASAYFFSKDASHPEITQVRTMRSDSGIDIEVVAQDAGAGLNAIRVVSTVNGALRAPTTLDIESGNFRDSSTFAGEITEVAPADAVMVQVEVNDEFQNALSVNLPIASAGEDFSIECTSPGGASVPLDGSNSATPLESLTTFQWNSDFGTASGETAHLSLPIGSQEIGLRLEDGRGYTSTDAVVVTVADTTPPDLMVSVSPAVLWPPNHKLVEITPELTVSDSCDSASLVELLNITMNEGSESLTFDPSFDDTVADGHTVDDIQVDEDGRVFLRAERTGTGEGRVYTLTYRATDVFGNSTTATATVTVPHNL